ncbi:MAG: hypothetical protein GX080_03145 [Tissierellia bacterium]|nr:hypothetical protein [Tissierellia bacterium]
MRRKSRRKILHVKSTIFIVTIIALSSIGVGYGYWNEGLTMDFSITTGEVNLCFVSGGSTADGNINATPIKDGKALHITGEVISGYSGNVIVGVKNIGTVPVVLGNTEEEILPNQIKEISIPIEVTYSEGESLVDLQDIVNKCLESEGDIEKVVDERINTIYPVQEYKYEDTYRFEQVL